MRSQSDRCPNQAQCCFVRQFAMAQADVKPHDLLERLKRAQVGTSLCATVASPGSSNTWLHAMCLGLMPEQLCTCKAQPSLAVYHSCMLGSQDVQGLHWIQRTSRFSNSRLLSSASSRASLSTSTPMT